MHQEEPTLLDHFNDVRSAYIPEGGVSTVIYCGTVSNENDIFDALQLHRKIVEDEVNSEESNITGILIGQGNCILHLLEGPSYALLRVLNGLVSSEQFSAQAISSNNSVADEASVGGGGSVVNPSIVTQQTGNIVYNVEDRPRRFFPEWYSTTVQEKKAASGEELSEENCRDVVFDMANELVEIGTGLQSQAQEELELTRYASKIPGKALIQALAVSPLFFPLEDFVQFNFDPYHIELETEQTWPLDRVVKY